MKYDLDWNYFQEHCCVSLIHVATLNKSPPPTCFSLLICLFLINLLWLSD